MHDEDNDDDDYTGDVDGGNSLSATDLRGTIRGVVGNNSNGRAGLTGSESRAGVVVNLHAASAPIRSGANRGRRTAGSAVVATAETDDDGAFMFENLQVGKYYFVKPQGTDLYTAVRNGSTGIKDEKTTDVVTHALTQAIVPDEDYEPNDKLSWDAHTSTLDGEGPNDFALLYTNGEVEGEVSDPSVRGAHKYSTVEVHLCKETDQVVDATSGEVTTEATQCDSYTGDVDEASVDSDGEWIADGLREGVYEVVVDLPAGYIHVATDGSDAGDGYFSQQLITLSGGRADASTMTFHIKDRNAGSAATLTSVEIDGDPCTTGAATNKADEQCGHSDDGSFSVEVTASTGATVRLSNSATNPRASSSTVRSLAVRNGRTSTVTLSDPGSETFYVHVAAEDGYSTNDAATAGFNVRRDADVRVKDVTISWSGDRIELDREGLDLDPDGETDPVTGTTTLRITVDKGDNAGAIPIDNLTVNASGMTTEFGEVSWGTVDVDADTIACSTADFTGLTVGDGTLTLPLNAGSVKGSDGACFRITDSDGNPDDLDANTNNTRDYILIVTRK
jgi:hypothetical protein